MDKIEYRIDSEALSVTMFLSLVNKIWPGDYMANQSQEALNRTLNITAWQENELVGCVRLLSDGYFFSTITEILVDPEYQNLGIGSKLMEIAFRESPSTLSFGVQAGNESFFTKLGYEKGLDSYQMKKNRNSLETI